MRRQFREAHYSPQAISVFDSLTESGADYVKASTMMDAVESTAKAWADRNRAKVADWQGDGNKVADLLSRMDERIANPETIQPVNLGDFREVALTELTVDQKQAIADTFGLEASSGGNTDTFILDANRLDTDLRGLLDSGKTVDSIPDSARPALDALRDSVMDMAQLANRNGLLGGMDADLASAMGKAIQLRQANQPHISAFIVQQANLDSVLKQYGDFQNLSGQEQAALIKDMAKSTTIDFDRWNMPIDQKGMFGFIDTEMKPILDKLMNRRKRKDATQEALAKKAVEADGINLDRFAEFAAQITGNGDIRESAAVKARELQIAERFMLAKVTELAAIANETMAPGDIVKWHVMGAMHQQIHGMLRGVRSESGHLLQAWNFIKKDPDLENIHLNQMFENMGGLDGAQHRLTAFANAKTDADRASVLSDSLRAKTVNMFIEYRTMNMLSSIKTHVVNTAGNAGTLTAEVWNRFLAEHMGQGQGVVRGETFELINGIWEGYRKVKQMWSAHKAEKGGTVESLRTVNDMWGMDPSSSLAGDAGYTSRSLTKENALDVISGVKQKAGLSAEHGAISNGLSTMVEYTGRMLGINGEILLAMDQFFKTIAWHGEVAALNHREAVKQSGGDKAKYQALKEQFRKNIPVEHKRAGLEFGKLITFQTDLTGFAKTLNEMRQKHPLTRALIPFFKTPVNIMKYSARHTPGLAGMFGDIRAELNSSDLAVRHLAEARVMTGTFVWATAIGMAASGLLTGAGPTDDNEREKARATGWQPNSLRIPGKDGDTYIALDRLDPAAFLLNTAASLVEIYDGMDGDDLSKAMWAGLGAAFRVASDRTYLKSISDAVDAVTDWEGYKGDRARQGLFTSMVPASSMLRAVTQQVDPVQREVQGVFDSIRAGIPGASDALPVRRNFLGEAVQSDGFYGPDWLSPLRQSNVKTDPVYDEIYRLTKGGYQIPSMPDRHIRHNGRAVRMDGEQYSQFLEMAGVGLRYGGRNAKERIADTIASSGYQNWTDEQKAKQIRSIIESYRQEAKKQIKMDPGMRYLLGIN